MNIHYYKLSGLKQCTVYYVYISVGQSLITNSNQDDVGAAFLSEVVEENPTCV